MALAKFRRRSRDGVPVTTTSTSTSLVASWKSPSEIDPVEEIASGSMAVRVVPEAWVR
jgi:hypothetical protein